MRAGWPVLVLLLLPMLAPLAVAAEGSYAVSSTLTLASASSAQESRRITYDSSGPIQWRFPLPPGGRFDGATDDRGATLTATVDRGEVSVRTTATGNDRSFTLRFTVPAREHGPYVIASASVAAAGDSPVRVSASAPDGWALVGARASDGAKRGADGSYSATGPATVDFLFLGNDATDARPEEDVEGEKVLRFARARLLAESTILSMRHVYDTDTYSPNWTIPLPPGARFVSASTSHGEAEATASVGVVRIELPYPSGFGLGAREFDVTIELPPPDAYAGTFLRANVSVPAGALDDVRLALEPDASLTITGIHAPEASVDGPLSLRSEGPITVSVGLAPAPGPGRARIDAGLFIVEADEGDAAAARAVALNATELLATAASFAGGHNQTRPFYVTYTDAPVFAWEEGFYTVGLNTIAIRADDLGPSRGDGRPHLGPVRTLVHEATHGLLDRGLPEGPHNVSFFDEGLARLAETRVERAFAGEVLSCGREGGGTRCERDSSRPDAAEVQAFHRDGREFPAGWSAAGVGDAERAFLYGYSGLVFDAFERRAPGNAVPALLWHMTTLEWTGDASVDGPAIADLMATHAPELTRDEILYPGRELAGRDIDEFYACMGQLVAPAYPFDAHAYAEKPDGGCGALEQGRGTGANPPPPDVPAGGFGELVPAPGIFALAVVLAVVALARARRA